MKKLLLVVAVAICAGCGGGSRSGNTENTPPPTVTLSELSAGAYIGSSRDDSGRWVVTTTKGAFATYSSLRATPGDSVNLDRYTYTATGAESGKFLISEYEFVGVESVIHFAP